MTDPIALDRRAAAEALGIGISTLDEWTRVGFVPSIKRGGIRLYSVDALRRWADEASAYEEVGRGRTTSVGHGLGLQAPFGRTMGRIGQRRDRPPRPLHGDGAGGAADAR